MNTLHPKPWIAKSSNSMFVQCDNNLHRRNGKTNESLTKMTTKAQATTLPQERHVWELQQ